MIKIKSAILLAFILVSTELVLSQSQLIFRLWDGTENTYTFNTLTKLTFSDKNIEINKVDGTKEPYALSTVRKLVFNNDQSGIKTLPQNGQKLILYPNPVGDYLFLKNIPSGSHPINIYSLDGTVAYSGYSSSSEERIDLSALPAGFYVLKMSNNALKFTKE
ncbi:MAG: hypothetical protein BGO29_12480 [Bacteroidales bacterium 36-12]|nr:MAG: hypothetical protein BGO29_12480 [Bacteroidales bacterium 36-12]